MSLDLNDLKRQPLPLIIEQCIASVDLKSQVQLLQLVSLLLKYTIPEVYLDIPASTKDAIIMVFRTPVGLGNLIGRLAMYAGSRKSESELVSIVNAYVLLLNLVFKPNLVRDTLNVNPTKADLYTKEIEKLLFRGKAFSVVCELCLVYPNLPVSTIFQSMDAYSQFLSKELLVLSTPVPFIGSLFSLGSTSLHQFFDVMFCPENLDILVSLGSSMKRFERKTIIKKFFEYAEHIMFKGNLQASRIEAIYIISNQFLDGKVWDELLIESLLSKCSYSINLLMALLINDTESNVLTVLRSWGNKTLMEKEPITKQEFRTHFLACLVSQLSAERLKELLKDLNFMSAVSNRLLSQSSRVKSLGIVFADELSNIAGEKAIFSVDVADEVSIPGLRVRKQLVLLSLEEAWEEIRNPTVMEDIVQDSDIQALQLRLEPVKISNSGNEESSDEEDDPSLASSAKKVPKPLYIRDLLAYLLVDTKDSQAYEKRKIALKTAPYLFRQKTGFGSDIKFYAEDLMKHLAALSNFYEEDDFEAQKLNAMIALVVAEPSTTVCTCNLLLTGDYSLQQRICLLSTVALAARELRGFQRDDNWNSAPTFASKMLPEKLHRLYLSMDSEYGRIETSIQDLLMAEPAEKAKDQLAGGKILRISSKLTKKKELSEPTVSKEQLKYFGSIVGKTFFYPLIAVWYESGGISVGHYTPILIGHYIRSLSLILHSAYPVSADITEMAREYLDVVVPILQNLSADQLQITESIVTGLMIVFDIVDDLFIVTHFEHQMSVATNVIQQLFESIIDDKVKSLCAGFLYKSSVLRENLERSLMDQMNGSFYS